MASIMHSTASFLRDSLDHPARTSLTAALVAGTITAILAARYVKKQPKAGDNVGVGVFYAAILFLSGPTIALFVGSHLYTVLAYGPIRLGLLIGGEFLFIKFLQLVRRF